MHSGTKKRKSEREPEEVGCCDREFVGGTEEVRGGCNASVAS